MMQGRREPALRWLESSVPPDDEAMMWWLEIPSVTRRRALIVQGAPAGLTEAEEALREHAERAEAHHNTCQLIVVLSLQAVVGEKQGKTGEATRFLERAVTLARPGGFVFPFRELGPVMAGMLQKLRSQGSSDEFLDRVLATFEDAAATRPGEAAAPLAPGSPPARAASTSPSGDRRPLEDLTNRELDILELLAQRLQNKEIAERLSISPQTVSSHLKNIYQKLEVSGRRQAVARAVELGIVGSP